MKIIAFANRKGGTGKTTLLALLALYWAQAGKRVAIRDMDAQGSAEAFVNHIELDHVSIYEDRDDIDYLLVDTPGGIAPDDLKAVVKVADLILVPMLLSPTDIRATAEAAQIINAPKKTGLVFNQVNRQTSAFKDRGQYAKLLVGVKPLKAHLAKRVGYGYAMVDGLSALDTKARAELAALAKEVR
jgi:chromosome partitioning protein